MKCFRISFGNRKRLAFVSEELMFCCRSTASKHFQRTLFFAASCSPDQIPRRREHLFGLRVFMDKMRCWRFSSSEVKMIGDEKQQQQKCWKFNKIAHMQRSHPWIHNGVHCARFGFSRDAMHRSYASVNFSFSALCPGFLPNAIFFCCCHYSYFSTAY